MQIPINKGKEKLKSSFSITLAIVFNSHKWLVALVNNTDYKTFPSLQKHSFIKPFYSLETIGIV